MTYVDIKVTEWCPASVHSLRYDYECNAEVDGERVAGFLTYSDSAESIAESVLVEVIDSGINDPEYRINLWEGHSPFDPNQSQFRYTKKPPVKMKEELEILLHDETIISRSRECLDHMRNTQIKLVVLRP